MPTTCDGPHAWKMCQQRLFPRRRGPRPRRKNRERETEKTARDRAPTEERVVVVVEERERSKREKTKRNRESERPKSDDDERYPTCIFKNTINIVSQLISYPIVKVVRPNHINLTPKRKKRHARVAFRLIFSSPRSRLDDDDF